MAGDKEMKLDKEMLGDAIDRAEKGFTRSGDKKLVIEAARRLYENWDELEAVSDAVEFVDTSAIKRLIGGE